jgi:hypothetical protein
MNGIGGLFFSFGNSIGNLWARLFCIKADTIRISTCANSVLLKMVRQSVRFCYASAPDIQNKVKEEVKWKC